MNPLHVPPDVVPSSTPRNAAMGAAAADMTVSDRFRLNQLGFHPAGRKIAYHADGASGFDLVDAATGSVVFSGSSGVARSWDEAGLAAAPLDFTEWHGEGRFFLRVGGERSPIFAIAKGVFHEVARVSLRAFYYQRCSTTLLPRHAGRWARAAGHPDLDVRFHPSMGRSGSLPSPGGWYDAGDYNKYVVNAGITVGTLLAFHEFCPNSFPDGSLGIPESGNGRSDLLDEVRWELDWLLSMQDADGGVFFKTTSETFSLFVMPKEDRLPRWIVGKSTAAALDFAAMMAVSARVWRRLDSSFAAKCLSAAERAWVWAERHPDVAFRNPSSVRTGEYGDDDFRDEWLWAAAELLLSTGGTAYRDHLVANAEGLRYRDAPHWRDVRGLAVLSLVLGAADLPGPLIEAARASLLATAEDWVRAIDAHVLRAPPCALIWGSNSIAANQGVALLWCHRLTGDARFLRGAIDVADYLLGRNAPGFCFVTGFGWRSPMRPHHRPSAADGIDEPVPGLLVGGPNGGPADYVDEEADYRRNEVAINWNAPAVALFAGIEEAMRLG